MNERKEKLVCECVYDITTVYAAMLMSGKISEEDSRYAFDNIYKWAVEFEEKFEKSEDKDYMTEIEEFAFSKLANHYFLN